MKNLIFTFLSLIMCSFAYSQTIEGVWNTEKENTTVKIIQEDGEWVGKIKSSDNDQAPIGKIIIKEVVKTNGIYKGKLFVAKKKKWYNATFKPKNDELEIKISTGWTTKAVEWKKVKS